MRAKPRMDSAMIGDKVGRRIECLSWRRCGAADPQGRKVALHFLIKWGWE